MKDPTLKDIVGDQKSLQAPRYLIWDRPQQTSKKIFLGAECMRNHTADAGWQLTLGFEYAGYELWGYRFENDLTHVPTILERTNPAVVVVQDKREWECLTARQRNISNVAGYRFREIEVLKERNDIFKTTVLKDCHQKPQYHRESAEEIGVHAWIVYYHPAIVKFFASYVRQQHLIRTYHTVNPEDVPPYTSDGRKGCILSGAVSAAYPLRSLLLRKMAYLPETKYFPHPGYHHNGCQTPKFLSLLSNFKVAICTSSRFGYALRKIIEATACGCIVITDLPVEDKLPLIDDNLVRIPRELSKNHAIEAIKECLSNYDSERQKHFADLSKRFYDWRAMSFRLAYDIQEMRIRYANLQA